MLGTVGTFVIRFGSILTHLGMPGIPKALHAEPKVSQGSPLGIQVGSRSLKSGGLGLISVSSIKPQVVRVPVGRCRDHFGVLNGVNIVAV